MKLLWLRGLFFAVSLSVPCVFGSEIAIALGDVDLMFNHRSMDGRDGIENKNLGNEVLYQIFVDRFANGNPANDCIYGGKFCSPDRSNWYRFWGGDLRGIVQRVPYLKSLGVTRLWLTPIFENMPVTVNRQRHGADAVVTAYHGYWFKDLFRLSPFFTDEGTEDYSVLGELVRESLPEMKLLLDTAVNHTSPSDANPASLSDLERAEPIPATGDPWPRTHRGALFRAGDYVSSMDEDSWRIGQDAQYQPAFHHFGSITDWNNPFQLENYMLDGLSDLSQADQVVAKYFKDAHRFWLEMFPDLAGFRMDTIKHVSQAFWEDFSADLYRRFPKLEIVGEFFGAGPTNASSYPFYRRTKMSLFDFDFRSAIESIFMHDGSFAQLAQLWAQDPSLADARFLVTFIDNHDLPRMRGQGMTYGAMKQAMALMFASRGVPCLFYGQEQDLFVPGDPGDPYNRPMMTSFDQGSDMFRYSKRLIAMRKHNDAARYGATHMVHLTPSIVGFEREFDGRYLFFAASKNVRVGADEFAMQGLHMPDGTYQDVVTGKSYQVSSGKINVSLKTGDVILLSSTQKEFVLEGLNEPLQN